MKNKGLLFNIQRYSIHDGGGIRTIVFLKGCPLACPWCSNPESRLAVQPTSWVKNGKKETVGKWYDVETVVNEVLKDEIFYRTSGGGVTLSGGEVLMQADFAAELLAELHDLGIHTAIETTGCFPVDRLAKLLPYLDQVLFDLKLMNAADAKRVIGLDVNTIKENFELAAAYRDEIDLIPRVPLIPGYTAVQNNLLEIIDYLNRLDIKEVHLLPFHQYGSSKYEYLGWNYEMKDSEPLSKKTITEIRELFENNGIHPNVDGLE
ncbi:glycyl-radical enzyme activating protein [Enterococcus sp. BWB1-3]|uniref:glycyl-radical enzyme activating protein n=1 Tax=unclassified Enterococcus TaxID=2608891 RepID=UPI0019251377|nr:MULTISPECIES: glycyl-radical enzyme activating protein [unclassified Enterococcus]MBL1229808.1 glycyl-radical enzyme activating protein [Enterococcus sp. BWB1-3]MCB5952442.1 glycyl-radical enzyme activating protein [Enterococcus sp. BWT-B8]MCB5955394.1 glycyl-radical enzyme activating protein [Enterococcus sp. CWB-B31]